MTPEQGTLYPKRLVWSNECNATYDRAPQTNCYREPNKAENKI